MRNFLLLLAAVLLIALFSPLAFVLQGLRHLIMRKPLADLFWQTAIGLDQLGGSIIYLEPDWTISSRTYWLANTGNKYAAWFELFINFFFGKEHCQKSYENEFESPNRRGGPRARPSTQGE